MGFALEKIVREVGLVATGVVEPPAGVTKEEAVLDLQKIAQHNPHARAWELARQQGVQPIRNLGGDHEPLGDDVDEFLNWIDAIRHNRT